MRPRNLDLGMMEAAASLDEELSLGVAQRVQEPVERCGKLWLAGKRGIPKVAAFEMDRALADAAGLDLSDHVDWWWQWCESQPEIAKRLMDYCAASTVATGAGGYSYDQMQSEAPNDLRRLWMLSQSMRQSSRPNVFSLSEPLAQRLLLTELRGIRVGDVRLPYEGLFIEVPPGLLESYHPASGFHPVELIAVAEGQIHAEYVPESLSDIPSLTGRRLMIVLRGGPNEHSTGPFDDDHRYMEFGLQDDDLDLEAAVRADREAVREALDRTERRPTEAVINETLSRINPRPAGPHWKGRLLGEEHDGDEMTTIVYRLVVNFLMYMHSPGREVRRRQSPKANKLRKRMNKAHRRRSRLKIERELAKLDSHIAWDVGLSEQPMDAPKDGWQLTYRTTVRGHWRWQAHGPRHSLRKLIWIRPHARGPGDDALGHDYVVREGK